MVIAQARADGMGGLPQALSEQGAEVPRRPHCRQTPTSKRNAGQTLA